ncbi:neuropeptide FF receptor 2 [Drosophila grimshawi]|uniref:GH22858 n=1 Tax=Drosophila grimshawi TaxID=7222 RepID=B4JVX1_DROGR|nr:neuropeptide FF receptor 2 [Drosophila grimshawi]EDV98109.1 GH22858 [Drosophila grimshawi]
MDFDFSQWDFPEDRIWLRIPSGEIAWKVCSFLPLIIFGLYGNSVMIYLIAANRTLRTPTNLIVANMAVADCLTLLICPTMFMINDFYQNYQLGYVGCKMEGFVVVVFLITAVLNLSVVSYDRLTAIVLPLEKRLTLRAAKIVIFCTWLAGVLLALPLAIYRDYRVRVWRNFTERYCKENINVLPKYWYVLITVLVWLPLGIMLICYTAIFIKLDRYEKRVLSRENPLSVNYKRSVAKTLFIVVIVFGVLRLPFTIFVVLREKYYNTEVSVDSAMQYFSYFSQYLMFVNAAVNPLIYGFNNENFRRAYAEMSCVKRRRAKGNRVHHCCYCDFIKKNKNNKQTEANANAEKSCAKEISQSATAETKRLQETSNLDGSVEDTLVAQIDGEGFI